MQQHMKQLSRHFMAEQLWNYRTEQHLTQEEMAEMLWISPRSCIDLEHGRYRCSMMTIFLFLLWLEDDAVLQLVDDFRSLLQEETEYETPQRPRDHKRHLQHPV